MNMRPFMASLLAITMVASTAPASGGTARKLPLSIDLTGRRASGSVMGLRAANDRGIWIQCAIDTPRGYATCIASSGSTTGVCTTTDPAFFPAIHMINKSSYIEFSWDADGNCTRIFVRNGSQFLP
jgi:hypothetical protein